MFDLITNLFEKEEFNYGYKFSYFIIGITKNSKSIGIQLRNNEKIFLVKKYILHNNEFIYYFEDTDFFGNISTTIRIKFYTKNNNENMVKDFYYHIFSVELDLDLHNIISEHEVNIINCKNIKINNQLLDLIDYFSQDRKIINNKIPFIQQTTI